MGMVEDKMWEEREQFIQILLKRFGNNISERKPKDPYAYSQQLLTIEAVSWLYIIAKRLTAQTMLAERSTVINRHIPTMDTANKEFIGKIVGEFLQNLPEQGEL